MKKSLSVVLFLILLNSLMSAEKISISALSMSGQNGSKNSTTVLSGNAYIKTETMEILADRVELTGKDYQNIKATGNVSGKNLETQMEFKCDTLEFDRETKVALLRGNVNLKDIENDLVADAQIIEYDQEAETAVLQIQIKMIQKDNVCTGAYAFYQKKNQMLEISGNAQVKQGENTFRAQQISLNLKTQDIKLDGNVKGSFSSESSGENTQKDTSSDGESEKKPLVEESADKSELKKSNGPEVKEKTESEEKTEIKNELKPEEKTESEKGDAKKGE